MRRIRWVLGALALAAATVAVPTAYAATAATLTVSPPSVAAGGTLTAKGAHFGAGESVDLSVDSTRVATAKASSTGTFSGKHVTVPAGAKPGKHTVRAVGRTSHRSASAPVTVRPPVDWPQFRGGPSHTGVNPTENVLTPATVGKLKQRWTLSGPAWTGTEVGGVGYWFLDGKVTAFDPLTGSVRWAVALGPGTGASAPPAVAGGRVFVGTNKGTLVALNAKDGTTAWTRPIDVNSIRSAPTVAGGVLYAMGDDRSDRLQAIALDPATGAIRWQTQLVGAVTVSSPTVAGGLVFVGAGIRFQLSALDAATGALRWQNVVASGNETVIAANGLLYTNGRDSAANGFIQALDPATGRVVWSTPGGGSLAVTDRTVYAVGSDPADPVNLDRVQALDAGTGAVLWTTRKLASADGVPTPAPVVAGGVVYVNEKHLYALDAGTGALLWTGPTTGTGNDPVVVNGTVLVPVQNPDFTTTLRAYRP